MKRGRLFLFLIFLLLPGCTSAPQPNVVLRLQTYHDPSFGWTASVPADWYMCNVPVGQFVRGLPLSDPTRLFFWTYHNRSVGNIQAELESSGGVIHQTQIAEVDTPSLHWIRYRGDARNDKDLNVEFALATDGSNTHLIALLARYSEIDALVESALLPAVESFVPGAPDAAVSVLAVAPSEPDYWPTQGWRTASPESQDMDATLLDSMLELIRREQVPLDSLTIVRHGYLVLDKTFPPFETDDLHELHSATKSITSALVGIALHTAQTTRDETLSVQTPLLDFFSSRRVTNMDERKRAITLENVLTMTSGLEWTEWDAAYESGTGNDLVTMIESSRDWTQYVLDRPMAAEPGITFVYNSGGSHLLSAAVTQLSELPAADLATERLFAPLGIHDFEWSHSRDGTTAGWANLQMHPKDLARIGLLYLQRGKWDGQQIIPAEWIETSTTDHVPQPEYEYGYQWWLDLADNYAFMAGRFGQVVIVAPRQDMVIVFTAHLPDTVSDVGVTRWLAEKFILAAAN
jgi:CubicO group peptidase (beta-lactamase class C family)